MPAGPPRAPRRIVLHFGRLLGLRRLPQREVAGVALLAALKIALAFLLGSFLAWRATLGRKPEVKLAYATRSTPGANQAGAVLTGSGYVVTGDRYISLGVRIPGRIEEYLVDEGEAVVAGQALVRLDDRNYAASLREARAGADAPAHAADGVCLVDSDGRVQWLAAIVSRPSLERALGALAAEVGIIGAPMHRLAASLDLIVVADDGTTHDIDTWHDLAEARAARQEASP